MARTADDILNRAIQAKNRSHSIQVDNSDPVVETEMLLDVSQIDLYDRNPRRHLNEKYDSLKLSLAQRGYTSVLEISRRPGNENYMVCAGSNTTLLIIKELFEETGDRRFKKIRCLFKPWTAESDTLINHLIENDTHGRMIFIDRAEGVLAAKAELEVELNSHLGSREFCKIAKEKGLSIDHTMLSRYQFAVDFLASALPQALGSGMGKHQIEKIRKYKSSYEKYLEFHELLPDSHPEAYAELDEAYLNILAEFDAPMTANSTGQRKWSMTPVEKRMEEYLANTLELPLQTVKLDIATLLDMGELNKAPIPPYNPIITPRKKAGSQEVARPAPPELTETAGAAPSIPARPTPEATAPAVPLDTITPPTQTAEPEPPPPVGQDDFQDFDEKASDVGERLPGEFDIEGSEPPGTECHEVTAETLEFLREQFLHNIQQLADRYGIGDRVFQIPHGPGAYIDFPMTPYYTEQDEEVPVEALAWYFLAGFTEQLAGTTHCLDVLPDGSTYKFHLQKSYYANQRLSEGTLPENEQQDLLPFDNQVGPEPELAIFSIKLFMHWSFSDIECINKLSRLHWHMRGKVREIKKVSIWEI